MVTSMASGLGKKEGEPLEWGDVARIVEYEEVMNSKEWAEEVEDAESLELPPYPSVHRSAYKWPGSADKAEAMLKAAIAAHRKALERASGSKSTRKGTRAAAKVAKESSAPEAEEPPAKRECT